MNFFNSVFPDSQDDNQNHHPDEQLQQSNDAVTPWSFGTLIKTIASKSESVIDTYRKDLHDFGSGLRAETSLIRRTIVNDLPASLDRGASVAQQSLESFGQAIDDLGTTVLKGAAVIKNSILAVDDHDAERHVSRSFNSVRLSRFEEGLKRMKWDEDTYCKDVEEKDEYEAWREVFRIGEKGSEIMDLIAEDDVVETIYKKLVPKKIDHETFWCRYFYRLYKLKQVEEAREKRVKRAIIGAEEEDLSWDVEDDDEYDEGREKRKSDGGESGKESDISVVSARPSFHEGDSGWDEIEDVASHGEGRGTGSGSCSSPVKVDLRKLSSAVEEDEELSWDIEDDESLKA